MHFMALFGIWRETYGKRLTEKENRLQDWK